MIVKFVANKAEGRISKRSQNIAIDGNLIKEKVITYAKELDYNNFHGSAGWLDRWKKR